MKTYKTSVSQKQNGQKIDRALLLSGIGVSRREVRRLLDNGHVTINSRIERFASKIVNSGDKIIVKLFTKKVPKKELIIVQEPFIIYEDQFTIIINKPPHLLSQGVLSKKDIDAKAFVLNYLKTKNIDPPSNLILCHRLDKETSGSLLFAKSKDSAAYYMELFKKKQIKKVYEAICFSLTKKKQWTRVDHLSSLNKKTQKVHLVHSGGKKASTQFQVVKQNKKYNLTHLKCFPLTGRTHQLRVQLSMEGLPIVGDKKYNEELFRLSFLPDSLIGHHLLHAKVLAFKPFKESKEITVESSLPSLFNTFLKRL